MYVTFNSPKMKTGQRKKMKRYLLTATLILLPIGAVSATKASAEVNLNIGINLPIAGVVVSNPPDVVVISGTYVYFIPDEDEDVFFYHGYWYRPRGHGWARSSDYGSGWVQISIGKVPEPVREIPSNFRRIPHGHDKIPYGQLKKNWRSWEKERHWENASEERGDHDGHGGREHGKHKKGKDRGKD